MGSPNFSAVIKNEHFSLKGSLFMTLCEPFPPFYLATPSFLCWLLSLHPKCRKGLRLHSELSFLLFLSFLRALTDFLYL